MTFSDSIFLFDISIEEIKRLNIEEFRCKVKFSDFIETYLLGLKRFTEFKRPKIHKCRKEVKREGCKKDCCNLHHRGTKKEFGQTLLLVNKNNQIKLNMEKHHLELSFWSKTQRDVEIGTSSIPWAQSFHNYLKNISVSPRLPPAVHKEVYTVVNSTQKRLGTIKVTIKLVCTSSNFYKFISGSKNNISIYGNLFSNPEIIVKLFHITKKNSKANAVIDEILKIKQGMEESIHKSMPKNVKRSDLDMKEVENIRKGENSYLKGYVNHGFVNRRTKLKQSVSNEAISGKKYNAFDYIFGDPNESFKNRIYCVNYFRVIKSSDNSNTSIRSSAQNKKITFKRCNSECLNVAQPSTSRLSHNLQPDATSSFKIISCKEISCDSRNHRKSPVPAIITTDLDFENIHKECCDSHKFTGEIETVQGEVSAKIDYSKDQCFCSCECRFGFTKQTRYCKICRGYEIAGDDLMNKIALEMPVPCPIYHKLVDKNKLKTLSTSGSESKKKGDDSLRSIKSSSRALFDKRLPITDKKYVVSPKNSRKAKHLEPEKDSKKENLVVREKGSKKEHLVESEKDTKKEKKYIKHNRIQFTYGYKAPHIGHTNCASPCTGIVDNVPKTMGWFWTAGDCRGTKFRPMWKPGAINKRVFRLLRQAKNTEEVFGKKKRKEIGKNKRPLKRPLLTVHKTDGEYTVTMETMKVFTKPRAIHQNPYEDKPLLIYTIGRTEEENKQRQKKKDREQRRLEREQRIYLQSAFKNMCHEICLKTYQQALGILPNAEDPSCPCYTSLPIAEATTMNFSCSCSEDSRSGSDTDCDEWLIEFTPPNAYFDPSYKGKKTIKNDNSTQYCYLDYRVKLVDRYGNPVPRFFIGPDGKEQCSDLGGFFSPDHKWLEINVDGYVGPDGRWAPNSFMGPNGEQIDAEGGKFQDKNLQWLVVGVDGYVNSQGQWRFYSKHRGDALQMKQSTCKKLSSQKAEKVPYYSVNSCCFGDASPKQLSRLGISGHGKDKRYLSSKENNLVFKCQNTVTQLTHNLGRRGK